MIVGVSIEKAVGFRGGVQPVTNVYYYAAPIPHTDAFTWEGLVDQLREIEWNIHASSVSFVRGRLWRADGTIAENTMIVDKPLTGAGGQLDHGVMDRERAVLIQIPAGTDIKGRPVYLKKWYHLCSTNIGGVAVSNGALANTEQLTTVQRDAMAAVGEDIKSIGLGLDGATEATLTSKTNRALTGPAKCHPYLEHHQLGDAWRG